MEEVLNASHFELEPISVQTPRCAAGCGFLAKCRIDDTPICLACCAVFYDDITGERIDEWCRRKFLEREAASREAT